ncbi:MAG: adenylate/guanylate cyclase domain-containing protein [Parvibaculaceae bacterium]
MDRRLAAILAADAVAYSRLVGEDEEGALALFEACRRIIVEHIEAHQGRVFGGAGDSVIAEFQSPVEALRASFEIQHAIAAHNGELQPEKRMLFRIGLNLGDVVVEEANLLGEGVNIAVRLESIAEPGGIVMSESFYEQVKRLPGLSFTDLGLQKLKNISQPVRAFASTASGVPLRRRRRSVAPMAAIAAILLAAIGWSAWHYGMPFLKAPSPSSEVAQTAPLPEDPAIAVLPLANLSGDPGQDYFSDGITNDITTDLSKFSQLFVIASNSAFMYKGKPTKVQDVATALGVRYLLEGSVQRASDRVRINAQLIDASTGRHIWAERYDRVLTDVFAVQDEIVKAIVTALAVKVEAAELDRINRRETTSMDAYDYWLRGREIYGDPDKVTKEGNEEASRWFKKAIEADSKFARAYGHLAYLSVREWQNGWSPDGEASLKEGERLALKSVELGPDDYDNHWSLAIVYWNQGKFDQALREYDAARKLNENDADLLAEMGEYMIYGGRKKEAVTQILKAIKHNPDVPFWYWWNLGKAYYMVGDYKGAIDAIGKIADPPNDTLLILAAARAQLGESSLAKGDIAKFSKNDPEWTVEKSGNYHYADPKDREHWLDGLRKAGLKEK